MSELEQERITFEKWANEHLFDLEKIGGRYKSKETRCAWAAWIGRAEIP